MRQFEHCHVLPAAPASVLAIIASQAHLRRRYDNDDLLDFDLTAQRDDDQGLQCRVERTIDPGNRLPGPAKRLVGRSLTIAQDITWSRSGPPHIGKMRFTVPGMPGSIVTDLHLDAAEHGNSAMTAEGRVEVRIPLVGRQLEGYLVEIAFKQFIKSMHLIEQELAHA